jgi:hypothetical protein
MTKQYIAGLDEQAAQSAQSTISERLRSIDKSAWGEIENPNGFEYHMNIGLLVHQAADEIERLKKIMTESEKQYTPKLDANDQEQLAQAEAAKIKATLQQSQTPKWDKSPAEIGSEIASNFYPVASIFHADLRRQIIKAIEAEREVAKHYMTQMGRWWERLQS